MIIECRGREAVRATQTSQSTQAQWTAQGYEGTPCSVSTTPPVPRETVNVLEPTWPAPSFCTQPYPFVRHRSIIHVHAMKTW